MDHAYLEGDQKQGGIIEEDGAITSMGVWSQGWECFANERTHSKVVFGLLQRKTWDLLRLL